MGKPHKLKNVSKRLTKLLDIGELVAVGGDEYNIKAMSPDTEMPVCAECGKPAENHGRFERTLIDVVTVDGRKQFARLHYYFYKYRCLDKECGAVFQKPIGFAKENSKTTKRYEDEVVHYLLYESIDKAREDMEGLIIDGVKADLISKPAISKLVKRWVRDKDEMRNFLTPAYVYIYSYESRHRSYAVICESEDRIFSIVEVCTGIIASEIRQFFSRVETQYIAAVVIDCNPVIYSVVHEFFPSNKVYVDVDAVKKILENEYGTCVFERAKNYSKSIRANLMGTGVDLEEEDAAKLYSIRKNDRVLREAYKRYSRILLLLQEHQDIMELKPWIEEATEIDKNVYPMTLFYLEPYWSEIINYYKRRNNVSESTYDKLYALNEKIESYFSQCTDDVFRARMLYSDFKEIENVWRGMPVDTLLEIIDNMITEGGLKEHERKRRQN